FLNPGMQSKQRNKILEFQGLAFGRPAGSSDSKQNENGLTARGGEKWREMSPGRK
ncbi:hypothetical protein A2U01_0097933, partial [Trifolium medium]|nr:hypothetical protein [Trifolium medium]